MAFLSRSKIIEKTHGYKTEVVHIPEWGGDVLVRELNSSEVTRIGASAIDATGTTDMDLIQAQGIGNMELVAGMMPQIVAWTVCDENLNPILSVEDVRKMTAQNMEIIQMLGEKALELSGLLDEASEPDPN